METASVRRAPRTSEVIRLGLIFGLLLLAALAWVVTDDRMAGMDAGPGTELGTFGFYVTSWVVMMAAMMFPSIWPMVVMQIRLRAGKRERGEQVAAGTTTLFVAGYLITWTTAGVVFYALLELGRWLDLDALSWDRGGPYLAGGVILAAAIYQLTPLKDTCLRKCRSPLMFLLTAWRPGRLGAIRMGIEHGGWCVGCCWALMAALFALGVMSVGWMVFIAGLIAVEKLLRWKALANRSIAIVLVALGIAVAFIPERVPGLTVPNSPEAIRAMETMGMDQGAMTNEGMKEKGTASGKAMGDKTMGANEGIGAKEMGDQGSPTDGMKTSRP